MRTVIPRSFYLRDNVVEIAQDLIGKFLVTRSGGELTSGMITETEAYNGIIDRASHAFGGRRTARTEIMYRRGGTAYIYLCYGIHSLFNVVTNAEGIPHAVLIRGIKPAEGVEIMTLRTGRNTPSMGSGPGNAAKCLGIHYSDSGGDLCEIPKNNADGIWLEDRGIIPLPGEIKISARIGVNYAGEDAGLPYRFLYRVK